MEHTPAHPLQYGRDVAAFDLARWKIALGTLFAVFLAILFFVSGSWKLTSPFQWSQALTEFLVPSKLALPFTLLLGIGEAFGAILIVVPRFRRWGGWVLGLLLIAFMLYIGMNYHSLAGKECTCFPLVKRTIGPGFFAGDLLMLIVAAAAAVWARPPSGIRAALVILGAIAVFAGVSYGVNASRQSGLKAPDSITVDGKPYSLRHGHIFLFFYDPECMHCDAAARRMAKLNWKDTEVVGIPTRMPQFAADFLKDTKLSAGTSNDVQPLRAIFKFVDPPYGVLLDNGRQVTAIVNFDESEPAKTLGQAGFAN
ncbi:MAG: MauE/DoxX family redox-associated membrane protein [Bryobacteraceae bacterium]